MNKTKNALDSLIKALEAGMYGLNIQSAPDEYTGKLLQTITRLKLSNIKWHIPLKMEGLDATLKSVAFDSSKIKLHKNLGKKK